MLNAPTFDAEDRWKMHGRARLNEGCRSTTRQSAHHDESVRIGRTARRSVYGSRMRIIWPVLQTGHSFSSVFLSRTSASALHGAAEGVPSRSEERRAGKA